MYVLNDFSLLNSSLNPVMYFPNESNGLPPSLTCRAIALAPFKCLIGYLNLSPSEDSMKIDSILCVRPPATDWSTGLECFITSLASPID